MVMFFFVLYIYIPAYNSTYCSQYFMLFYGKLVYDEKEHSDWFLEQSEFCNTDH